MTLKEKVAEMEPDKINPGYVGGVDGCPGDFNYLNITQSISKDTCPYDHKYSYGRCEKCWNREFKESDKLMMFNVGPNKLIDPSKIFDWCRDELSKIHDDRDSYKWIMSDDVWNYILNNGADILGNISFKCSTDTPDYDRTLYGIEVDRFNYPGSIRLVRTYKPIRTLENMDVASFYPVEPIRHDFGTELLAKNMLNAIYGVKAYEPKPMSILDMEERLKLFRTFENKGENMNIRNKIKKVIFNDPATIVFWKDGTKTVVKCQDGEVFDPEKGLAMAISKRVLGNQGNYFDVFKEWIPEKEETKESFIAAIDRAIANVNRMIDVLKKFDEKKEFEVKVMSCTDCKHSGRLSTEEPCYSCCTGPVNKFEPKKITNARELGCITCKHSNKKVYVEEPCRSCEARFGNFNKWESTAESPLPSTEEMTKSVNEFTKVAAEHAGVISCKTCKYEKLAFYEKPCKTCCNSDRMSNVNSWEPKED